jgi:hypothetical protein
MRDFFGRKKDPQAASQSCPAGEGRDPRLARVRLDDIQGAVKSLLGENDLCASCIHSAQTLNEAQVMIETFLKNGACVIDRRMLRTLSESARATIGKRRSRGFSKSDRYKLMRVIDLITAVQAERARQSIGRALLSLIEASRDPQRLATRIGDVQKRIAELSKAPQPQPGAAAPQTIDEINDLVARLPAGEARQSIESFIVAVQTDVQRLREAVETWYDDSMERVTGVYKRRVQFYLFCTAFVVICAIGADTIRIIRTLSADTSLRTFVVAEAGRTTGPGGALALPAATDTVTETVQV